MDHPSALTKAASDHCRGAAELLQQLEPVPALPQEPSPGESVPEEDEPAYLAAHAAVRAADRHNRDRILDAANLLRAALSLLGKR